MLNPFNQRKNKMKQLSDCCKAEIKLTGSPEHKDAFACAKCGRIIGTPIKKQKPKELDWNLMSKLILNWTNESETYLTDTQIGQLASLFVKLLTQQRTELLEEIKKMEYGGYLQVMASKKNWDERNGYDMAKEEIINLLNKKDG